MRGDETATLGKLGKEPNHGHLGIIVLVFLVVHVSDFRLQRELITNSGGLEANLLAKLAVPWRAALYVVGSIFDLLPHDSRHRQRLIIWLSP